MMPTNRGGQNAVLIKILYVHPILSKSLDFFFSPLDHVKPLKCFALRSDSFVCLFCRRCLSHPGGR